jgi:hypothetical protein
MHQGVPPLEKGANSQHRLVAPFPNAVGLFALHGSQRLSLTRDQNLYGKQEILIILIHQSLNCVWQNRNLGCVCPDTQIINHRFITLIHHYGYHFPVCIQERGT